jgi:hypothetical protein
VTAGRRIEKVKQAGTGGVVTILGDLLRAKVYVSSAPTEINPERKRDPSLRSGETPKKQNGIRRGCSGFREARRGTRRNAG